VTVDAQQWKAHTFSPILREFTSGTKLNVRKKKVLVLNEIYKQNNGQ